MPQGSGALESGDVPSTPALGLAAAGFGQITWPRNPGTSSPSPLPGAGKTTALRIVAELLDEGTVDTVTIVVPTEHLKIQWAQAAAKVGTLWTQVLQLELPDLGRLPRRRGHLCPGGQPSHSGTGCAPRTARLRRLRRDPPRRRREKLGRCHPGSLRRRDPPTALTGTPFRSDDSAIPFVTYEMGPDGFVAPGRPHLRLLRRVGRRRGGW